MLFRLFFHIPHFAKFKLNQIINFA